MVNGRKVASTFRSRTYVRRRIRAYETFYSGFAFKSLDREGCKREFSRRRFECLAFFLLPKNQGELFAGFLSTYPKLEKILPFLQERRGSGIYIYREIDRDLANRRRHFMLIEVKNLCKRYTAKADYTIKDINLYGNAGEIIGVLGHNGAGKSTTIKCLTGMHPYEEGTIRVNGYDLKKDSINAKQHFGYVSDEHVLFEKMTGYEFVNFMADIYNVSSKDRKARVARFQELFMLGDSIYNPISSYSHGMKQKISFMGALIHNPKVFILDEPMVGLDPFTASQVKLFFQEHAAAGNLVLFSTHNLDVVEKLCDRVYIIDQGRIIREIDMDLFRASGLDFENYFLSITQRVAKA